MKKSSKIHSLIFLTYFVTASQIFSQIPFSEFGYALIDSVSGSVLYGKTVKNGKMEYNVFCQVVDLKQIKLSNFIDKTDAIEGSKGNYLSQKQFSKSPYFKTYTYDEALEKPGKKINSKLVGMINGGFFEKFGPFTQMAFPIKVDGKILSAGSSPNGPYEGAYNPLFKEITLKALVWTDSTICVKDYDTQSGFPLTEDEFTNGFVSYSSSDHPARKLRPTEANRFLVLGTLNMEPAESDHLLVILSINQARMEFAEAHLRQLGVKQPMIALGGDATTLIFNQNKGLIEAPAMFANGNVKLSVKLPHFILMTKK